MKATQLSGEQQRIGIDAVQLYEHFLELRQEYEQFRGGMLWKTVGSRQYLVKTVDRMGHQNSLGPRSPQTEALFRDFTEKKKDLKERLKSVQNEISARAKFCVAAGINRVPRIAADIVRVLDSRGLIGTHLVILGSHAIYAYEFAAGVQLKAGLLQTSDLDTLLDTRSELEIAGEVRTAGLLGLIRKVDKTFRLARKASFRAVNSKGFMVDLLRAPLSPEAAITSLAAVEDLIAEPLPGLDWLTAAPKIAQIVIAENGYPVRFVVPEPRVFALHKLWLSIQPTRDPVKRKRDFRQGEAVASLALEYLNMSFDDEMVRRLPAELRSMRSGLKERLRSRRSKKPSRGGSSLPPGFDDVRDE